MANGLGNKCAKHFCKRTLLVQLINKNMVTSFLEHVYKKDVSKKVAPPRNFLEYFRFGYVLIT